MTKGIFYLATPHHGSDLARVLANFGLLLRTSDIVKELGADEATLASLNRWYIDNAPAKLGISTEVLFEKFEAKLKVGKVLVVDARSSDIGISGVRPIAVDEDHISICKPRSPTALQRLMLEQFIDRILRPTITPE